METNTDSLPSWDVRPYRSGDEVELAALFSRVFGKDVTPEWWLWKLKGRESPVENVWVAVSEEDGCIIGQYAGIPMRLKLGDTVREVMVSVDTMTSPDFRRRGILTKLGAEAYKSWAGLGQAAVLGLPNEQWGSRTAALGWVKLFPLSWLRMPLRYDVMAANSDKVPKMLLPSARAMGRLGSRIWRGRWQRRTWRSAGVSVEEVTSNAGATAFDALWATIGGRYRNLFVRDGAWIRWRYLEAAAASYRILLARVNGEPAGYLTYKMDDAPGQVKGYIADLFVAPDAPNVARALLGTALDDLWRRKAGSVMATALPGSDLARLLTTLGFRPMRAAFSTEIVLLDVALDLAALSDPAAWHLSAGDFDVV